MAKPAQNDKHINITRFSFMGSITGISPVMSPSGAPCRDPNLSLNALAASDMTGSGGIISLVSTT
jgi:hypothetical protein